MGTSVAFLTELATQRSTALQDLHDAQDAGDDAAAAVALARIQDLDELLSRNGGLDVPPAVRRDAAPDGAPELTLDLDAAAAADGALLDDPALDTLTA